MKKLTYKEVEPDYIFINGWQVYKDPNSVDGRWGFPKGISREERKQVRNYIKGLKVLVKEANSKGSFETLGGQIHGNINSPKEKFRKLLNSSSMDVVAQIGSKSSYVIQSYVDGSYSIQVVL